MVSYIMYYYLYVKGYIMKKIFSRIAALLLVIALFASLAVPVSAMKKPEFLLAIGDSITSGYGLDAYDESDPYNCGSYANLLAEALSLEGKESYINKGLNGATSADILADLPDIVNYLGYADMVVFSAGVNDLQNAIPIIASAVSGKTVTGLSASIDVLTAAAPEKFTALANNQSFQKRIGEVLSEYEKNITDIAEIIKTNAPEARVIFLKQYNPLCNVPGFETFGEFADTLISSVNASMEKVCAAYGFDIVDVPSVINVDAMGLTNMLNYDIHPNAAGHVEIARLIASHLGISLDPAKNIFDAETEPETTATETTAVANETDAPEIGTEAQPETSGCSSSVSSVAIAILSVCAAFVLGKKR